MSVGNDELVGVATAANTRAESPPP